MKYLIELLVKASIGLQVMRGEVYVHLEADVPFKLGMFVVIDC